MGLRQEWQPYILPHIDNNWDGQTDFKMIRWSWDFWFVSRIRVVHLQSGNFRDGIWEFMSLHQSSDLLQELTLGAAVPAKQQTQSLEGNPEGDPEQNQEMRNSGKCVSGSFWEIFWGQGVILKFSHLIFYIVHFITCMSCLLHDFGWKEKWVKGPGKLQGFRLNLNAVIWVDCVIEES